MAQAFRRACTWIICQGIDTEQIQTCAHSCSTGISLCWWMMAHRRHLQAPGAPSQQHAALQQLPAEPPRAPRRRRWHAPLPGPAAPHGHAPSVVHPVLPAQARSLPPARGRGAPPLRARWPPAPLQQHTPRPPAHCAGKSRVHVNSSGIWSTYSRASAAKPALQWAASPE